MTKRDIKSASWLAFSIFLLVVSLTTGFLDTIIVPIGLGAFGILTLGCAFAGMFHFRKYQRDHPFVPYAGQWAHVLCKKCEAVGSTYSIDMTVGTAHEGWTLGGRYHRHFKRQFKASCSRGHSWKYDPFLQRNEWESIKSPHYRRSSEKIREIMRLTREMFHKTYVEKEIKSEV